MIAIRKYREHLRLTQADVADKCGVGKTAVSMWENGERKPDIIMLKKLANIFGCTADELLEPIQIDFAVKETAAPESEFDTAEKKESCISGITVTLHGDTNEQQSE